MVAPLGATLTPRAQWTQVKEDPLKSQWSEVRNSIWGHTWAVYHCCLNLGHLHRDKSSAHHGDDALYLFLPLQISCCWKGEKSVQRPLCSEQRFQPTEVMPPFSSSFSVIWDLESILPPRPAVPKR